MKMFGVPRVGRRAALGESPGATDVMSPTELIMQFESLGDNCEFGVVQRCCGAEPLGLFRLRSSHIENMIDVVTSKAGRLYTDDDLEIFVEHSLNEFCLVSRHYRDFPYHSQVDADSLSLSAFETKEAKRLAYLKQRFVEDLEAGQKIFVRKGSESNQEILRLHAALRAHGDNWLLGWWWRPAITDPARSTCCNPVSCGGMSAPTRISKMSIPSISSTGSRSVAKPMRCFRHRGTVQLLSPRTNASRLARIGRCFRPARPTRLSMYPRCVTNDRPFA